MSNKNHPNNNYRSIDILDLSVDDWFTPFSELAKRQSNNQAKDQEVTDGPKPEQPNQEQQPEAESVQETTATFRQTKERVIAEVALTGQSTGEKESVGSSQTGQDKPSAEVVESQDASSEKSAAERLASDFDWRMQGCHASIKVAEEIMELQGFNKYGDYLKGDSKPRQVIDQERTRAMSWSESVSPLFSQLYFYAGWSPYELLQKELLRRDAEEDSDNAKLVEALDAVHDLFNTTHYNHLSDGLGVSHDIIKVACDSLDYNYSDCTNSSIWYHVDCGGAGVIALYHLRKKLRDDEPIKKILRIADSGSEAEVTGILNDTDKSGDVVDYEQKLETIDRMVEQVDQYFDGAEVKESFTIDTLGVNDEEDALYRWAVVRNAEYKVACLSEDELRRNTERYADSATIYGWILAWGGKNLFEMADQIHDKDVKARERRKAKSSRTA